MRLMINIMLSLILLITVGCQEESPKVEAPAEKSQVEQTKEAPVIPVEKPEPVPTNTTALFSAPIEPVVVELPSEALPYWRDVATAQKPALVLFSIHPFLVPIDPELKSSAAELMANGTKTDFNLHGSLYRSEPLVLPTQPLSAAIDANLFSELIWVFPTTGTAEQMELELFQKQVADAGFLSKDEADQLTLENGVYSGNVRGLPFRGVNPEALPAIDKPMILHVDLGYFKGLYKGEVKTRIYDLLHQTALALKKQAWAPQLVTLSYSTMEGSFSLDVRFLITHFADMLRDPSLLEGTMPETWALRSEALYSVNFFLEAQVQKYYESNAEKYPEDAAAQYDLYRHMFFEQRKIDEALAVLDKAVSLDRGYAAAYLELAQMAREDDNLPAALELLTKAAPVVPENPMVQLYRAQYLIQARQEKEALPIIAQLKSMPWSAHYYPDTPKLLDEMEAFALNPPDETEAKDQ